jgi:hypothetical protein
MEWWWLVAAAVVVGAGLLVWLWQPLRSFGREVQVERARELFRLQRERLEGQFQSAAAASGKPRGLRWKDCAFEDALELARDKRSGQIVALVPVTIEFEAVEGGAMEGWHAVGIPRNASAVFFFERGQWNTVGKAVFNMNPDEALAHFKDQYERVEGEIRP